MKELLIADITREMLPFLNNAQMLKLQEVLNHCFWEVKVEKTEEQQEKLSSKTNEEYLDLFITAKDIEGCSQKTLKYYRATINKMFSLNDIPVTPIPF